MSAYLKVAIVHDWLTGMRGGEKVLLELLRLFPGADLHTLFWRRGSVSPEIESRVRQVSFLQRFPLKCYRWYLPLFPAAVRSLDLRGYRLIVSSSHAVAKSARIPPGAFHASYVHTPMRYLWDESSAYFRFGRGKSWKRAALACLAPWLRGFDRRASAGVDLFIANSENVRGRVRAAYGVDAQVVHPPVDTDFFRPEFAPAPPAGDYYLVVSALEPYKRIDLAIRAFSGGARRLLIAGSGTLERDLRALAGHPVEFLGQVSDERLRQLYAGCRVLVFPGREDFGMSMAEAQACGRPVVAFARGGAAEIVVHGRTGLLFSPQQPEALRTAVERAEGMRWDREQIRNSSLRFATGRFRQRFWQCLRAAVPFDLAATAQAGTPQYDRAAGL